MMMSEVEMPSVRWVGANIPVEGTKGSVVTRYRGLELHSVHQSEVKPQEVTLARG